MIIISTKQGDNPVTVLIEELTKQYNIQHEDLLKKVDSNVQKPLPIKPLPQKSSYVVSGDVTLGTSSSEIFKRKSYYEGWQELTTSNELTTRLNKIKEQAQLYINDCQTVYDANLPVIAHNKAIADKICALMKAIGIPDNYSESYFKSTRSSRKTTETKKAGYLHDIDRNIKTSQPSVPTMKDIIGDNYSGLEYYYNKLLVKVREAEGAAEKERLKKEEEHKIALLRAKYTPDDALSNIYTIREQLLSKNKYLHLAYWLERNRGDWNDGYSYAETGLEGFTVETAKDKLIAEDIYSYFEDFSDGRVFRDCEYNYGVLYSMVEDKALLADLELVKNYERDSY